MVSVGGGGLRWGLQCPLETRDHFSIKSGKGKLVEEERDIEKKRELFTSQNCLGSTLLITRVAEMA